MSKKSCTFAADFGFLPIEGMNQTNNKNIKIKV
jgi:hypothetical protein